VLELQVFQEGRLIQRTVMHKGRITLGRAPDSDVVLNDPHVSRRHAVIGWDDAVYRVEDTSTNGVLLDGERIRRVARLPEHCRLAIFPFEIACAQQDDDVTLPIDRRDLPPPPAAAGDGLHFGLLVGEAPPMREVYGLVEAVAGSRATVLVRGEPGTGKDLVARAVHQAGARRGHPFVAVNCAAIPVELTESELFGYEKGAFTGAETAQPGKVAAAEGGTLFLDEIGDLSPAAQSKLLRFLQERTFMRVGGTREVAADVQVVAATNHDLERAVAEGDFRADLYHRIRVVEIVLPPLRDRREDVPRLAAHAVRKFAAELGLARPPELAPETVARLEAAPWPGNVRELENTLHSALVRHRDREVLGPDDLGPLESRPAPASEAGADGDEAPLEAAERRVLLEALRACGWDTEAAARRLKVSRGTVYYRLKKHGIDIRDASRNPPA